MLRELDLNEMEMVSGGDTIVVTGQRQRGRSTSMSWQDYKDLYGITLVVDPLAGRGGSGGGGGGGAATPLATPPTTPEECREAQAELAAVSLSLYNAAGSFIEASIESEMGGTVAGIGAISFFARWHVEATQAVETHCGG